MKTECVPGRKDETRPGVCANEGCRRPAEAGLCDTCALEGSLFHREQRVEEFRLSDRGR
jgi:hypothetical protein